MAAIARAEREHRLSRQSALAAGAAFRALWPDLLVVEVDQPLVERADHLAALHALRGCDATHLAAATALHRPGEPVALVTWDTDLARAAAAEGLRVLPA